MNTSNTDPRTFRGDMREVILWHILLTELESITVTSGVGLALIWGHVRRGNFAAAREAVDRLHHPSTGPDPLEQDSLPITDEATP